MKSVARKTSKRKNELKIDNKSTGIIGNYKAHPVYAINLNGYIKRNELSGIVDGTYWLITDTMGLVDSDGYLIGRVNDENKVDQVMRQRFIPAVSEPGSAVEKEKVKYQKKVLGGDNFEVDLSKFNDGKELYVDRVLREYCEKDYGFSL